MTLREGPESAMAQDGIEFCQVAGLLPSLRFLEIPVTVLCKMSMDLLSARALLIIAPVACLFVLAPSRQFHLSVSKRAKRQRKADLEHTYAMYPVPRWVLHVCEKSREMVVSSHPPPCRIDGSRLDINPSPSAWMPASDVSRSCHCLRLSPSIDPEYPEHLVCNTVLRTTLHVAAKYSSQE